MAKNQELELSILIGGRVDNSLAQAVKSANGQIGQLAKTISNVGKIGLGAMTGLAVGTTKFFADATKDAMKYESTMAEVAKVVDELKDDNGNFTVHYDEMKSGLKDMTTLIPMEFEDAGAIAAAFGQSGVTSTPEILNYTADAAKMAIAFDSDAKQSGEWMATWKQAFNLAENEIVNLADQLNYLSNNTNATAADLAGIVTRVGSLGGMAGVNTSSVAAMADVLVATGVDDDSAATSLRNMFLKWTAGSAATKSEAGVMAKLGLDPVEFAKSMQDNSIEAIEDFFSRIKVLPQEQQISLMGQYFGKRAVESATKIAQNIPMLEQNLDWIKTKDENGQYVWQGSMENEYLTRSDTAENSIQLAKNAWRNLRESFGEAFLPVVKQGADWFVGFAKEVEANAPLIAGVTGQLAQLAQNGISALGGALESLWQIVKKFFEFINVKSENGSYDNSATVTKVIGGTAATFAAMSVAPQILQVVNGATRIFGGGKGTGPLSVAKDSIFGKGAAAAGNTVDMWNAAKLGAGLANSSMTQANGSPVTSSGIGGFLQNAENTIIGTIFGLKNKKQLTSKTSKPETLWKNVLKTADQITAAKSSGGLFGMLKGSSLGQYGTSVANSVKGLHGTNLVQQTIGVGKWLGQTAKNGVGGIASSLAGIFGSPMQNAMNSPLGNFITSIGQKAVGGVKNFAGNTLYGAKTLAGNIASSKVGQTAVKIGGGAVQGVKDVTQFLGAGLNVGQTVLGPVAGKLGGAFMGLLGTFGPVIAGIGSIIAVVSLLGDHFADIQQIVLKVFGPTGLKIFNTFFADVKKIGDGIKNAFSLDNLLNIQEKLSGKSMFGVDLGQAFGAAIPIIQSVTGLVSQIVDLGVNHIKPLLADVMSFVVNELFPAVAPLISTIIDLVGTTLVNAIKVIVDVIHGLLPVIEPVIQGIIGLIKGIASIGVSVVNTIIRALNKIHIKMPTKILGISLPEGIAGKEWGFSLAEVPAPAFANGGFTHGVSIAGEAGTEAVISFKRSVHDENVNHWVRAGRMLGVTGEDATRAIGPQNVSYFANGGFTDGSREKLDNLIDFSKAYGEYALRSNGIRTAGDAASLLWSVANNSMAGDGSLALAATSIAADVAPIVLKKYLGDNEATSLLTEAAKTYNGGTVLSSWGNGVLTDTGVPLYVLPPRDAGTIELSEIPQAAYRSSRTSGGGDGDGMQFVFSPQITAYGKADRAEIEQIMREQFEKFKAEIKKEIKEEQRREQRTKYA
jgi:TP901 family phage tail tape measure protein